MDSDSSSQLSTLHSATDRSDTDSSTGAPKVEPKRMNNRMRLVAGDVPSSSSSLNYKVSGRDGISVLKCNNLTITKEIDFGDEDAMVVRLSHDKQLWAVGLSRGSIKFYSVTGDSCNPVYTLTDEGEDLACTDLSFIPASPTDRPEKRHMLVASYASGTVRFWYYAGATAQTRLMGKLCEERVPRPEDPKVLKDKRNQILTLAISKTGRRAVTGGEDAVIRVYDVQKRREVGRCMSSRGQDRMDGHVLRVCSTVYHPAGAWDPKYEHIFISGGWDDSIHIWDDRIGHSLWAYIGPHISGSDSLDIDPLQNHILSGSWRRERSIVQVWKFNEDVISDTQGPTRARRDCERPLAELLDDGIQCPTMGYVARWMGNQYILYGGSNSNVVKVIDRNTLNTIGSVNDIPHGVYSMAFVETDPNDKRQTCRLAFCAGSKLFVMRLDKK